MPGHPGQGEVTLNVGIPDSFRDVFYIHYLTTVRKLQGLIGDPHAAEDLAQEAFLRLYRHAPDDMARVGAWLHRTVMRLGCDYLNQRERRSQRCVNFRAGLPFTRYNE